MLITAGALSTHSSLVWKELLYTQLVIQRQIMAEAAWITEMRRRIRIIGYSYGANLRMLLVCKLLILATFPNLVV